MLKPRDPAPRNYPRRIAARATAALPQTRAVARPFRVLDLFSGIGGFSLGLERAGMQTVAFCEIEPYCQAVLRKHWPEVPIYGDVRTLTAHALSRDGIEVDVICGGFPCQDISFAGAGAGIDGDRSGLWREYARLIGELRPGLVIVENVAALLAGPSERRGGWFGRVLGDLASSGYDAEWDCIPAAAVGAPHLRDRVWIMAYPEQVEWVCPIFNPHNASETVRKNATIGLQNGLRFEMGAPLRSIPGRWMDQPDPVRVAHGVSDWSHRLAECGNAVVPQIPELIGRAIAQAERAA